MLYVHPFCKQKYCIRNVNHYWCMKNTFKRKTYFSDKVCTIR